MTAGLAQAGGVAGALGLCALMLAPRRWQRLLGFGGWALGMAALAAYLAPHGHRGLLAGAAVVGLVLVALGAAVLVRWPWLLPFVALALVPARIPVSVGDTEANLLLPLYGVVGAAALALAWELPGEDDRRRELGPLAWPLGLWVAWTGISFAWTRDVREGAIELVFFVLPFGLLAVSLARLRWRPVNVVRLYALLALEGLLFAAIGLYQWATRDVFWNPKVIVPNAYLNFYRVNSVFYDPSIYGRFLAVAILAGVAAILWGSSRRTAAAVVAVIAVTWLGLYYSYSQSSFTALAAGLLIAAGPALALARARSARRRRRCSSPGSASPTRTSGTRSRTAPRRAGTRRRAVAPRSSATAPASRCTTPCSASASAASSARTRTRSASRARSRRRPRRTRPR